MEGNLLAFFAQSAIQIDLSATVGGYYSPWAG
jgi:hypothetical protein